MRITVRFFAILREQAKTASAELDLPDEATVADAIARISSRLNLECAAPRGPRRIAYAVNRAYCDASTPLHDGDELALIPPVSGG